MTTEALERAVKNLTKLVEKTQTVILDHHLLRDETWRACVQIVFQTAKTKHHEVVTAAEFLDETTENLEARRRTLYNEEPPSEAFNQWKKLPWEKRRHVKPPI
jgi:predicted metallo-beta-lactamase superfamily hydrolase